MTWNGGRGPWPWRSLLLAALWWLVVLGILALLFAAGYLFGRAVGHWPPAWRVITTWSYAVDYPLPKPVPG